MAIWRELKRRANDAVVPAIGLCVVGYFAYHAVEGDRGLTALVRLTDQVQIAKATAEELAVEREALERRVRLLRPGSLDPDLLEERARLILNLSRPGEIIIFDPEAAPDR